MMYVLTPSSLSLNKGFFDRSNDSRQLFSNNAFDNVDRSCDVILQFDKQRCKSVLLLIKA